MRWHFPASLLLHAAILLAVIFLQPAPLPTQPPDQSVHVEIVAPSRQKQPDETAVKTSSHLPEKTNQSPLTADKILQAAKNRPVEKIVPGLKVVPKPDPDALTVAKRLYSANLLADRHNRSARAAMKTLAVDERIIQLCNIEAMEQVKRANAALKPDYVIAYAMADLKLSAHQVDAEGGAFLSHRQWYGLKFHCGVSADDLRIVTFAFRVGLPIPRSQWAGHNLTADASSAD